MSNETVVPRTLEWRWIMNKSMIASLCMTAAVLVCGSASAAQPYRVEALPPLYVSVEAAQAACPTDQVVWVNWTARKSHLPDDRWYHATVVGAYACAKASAEAGIQPAQ